MHTHELSVEGALLTKRYTSWARGEHRREWTMLSHVHRYAPDLVPRPVAADLDAAPPWITMTVVAGTPLSAGLDEVRLDEVRLDALVTAILALWTVPLTGVDDLRPWADPLTYARRLIAGGRPARGVIRRAYDAALGWFSGPDAELLARDPRWRVIGHGDANLANYLWDGQRVRIIDLEDAACSDPEIELAILVEHPSARAVNADQVCALFDVDRARLRAARRAWAMFWLWMLRPGGPAAARNPVAAADVQARRLLRLLED